MADEGILQRAARIEDERAIATNSKEWYECTKCGAVHSTPWALCPDCPAHSCYEKTTKRPGQA